MKHSHTQKNWLISIIVMLIVCAIVACSPTRHVPEGEYLLDHVSIKTDTKEISASNLKTYIQQNPNYRIMGILPLQLTLYNLSGKDTTNFFNRWLRNLGDPPVLYSEEAMESSCYQLSKALSNMGYIHAEVTADTIVKNRRMNITYNVKANEPFYIDTLIFDFPEADIDSIVRSQPTLIKEGMLLNRSLLNQERDRLTAQLRNNGYFSFIKDYITFNADTMATSRGVELSVALHPMPSVVDVRKPRSYDYYHRYYINKVYVITDPLLNNLNLSDIDVSNAIPYKHVEIVYGDNKYLSKQAIADNCFIEPGRVYNTDDINRTYTSFGRLTYLKSINIRFAQHEMSDENNLLDCYIFIAPGRAQNISAELEGTNSEGDLGVAAQLSYQHRNIFKGSETFTTEIRGAYESVSGTIQGIINNHYTELGGRMSLKVPKFVFPFISNDFSRRILATTDFDVSLNYQQRPEYTRIIAGAGWRYNWSRQRHRHRLDLLDLNYVYLPQYMEGFLEQIAPANPLLRYSYEDHFIMGVGYNYYTSNISQNMPMQNATLRNAYTLRSSIETAGNLLYGISNAIGAPSDDGYKIFGIRYSQYIKANIDYSYLHNFNKRHSLAMHAGFGIGLPYGNSTVMPFEKRFYAGGANSVRGWSVRSLGPGSYNGYNNYNSFIYQCGDIRLDLSIEYRAKLFWKVESAIFIDAGNIWTIDDYETQPGGAFRFDTFYKQIALAYGLGLRLNFDFVVIRADFGMKAYNPADNAVKWAIANPNFKRDFAWHITIGYPF
ncbi:MAG: BamA/TamA family outer membrane protein [Bacteroidaceae bacterium]|nr:BamA/TamA family outer membrane protein [Bacteroidaceae bacterium]